MRAWRSFNRIFIATFCVLVVVVAAFIVWANPYRNIPGRGIEDVPLMDTNQRFLYPSVARDGRFDSAVFGTSSIRLLNPADLDREIGGAFAALAMNSATAWEQLQLARLVAEVRVREARRLRTVLWGIDDVWCIEGEHYDTLTFRRFPPWMYDHNPWNDLLHLFDGKTLEIAVRMFGYEFGLGEESRYQVNGFENFLPPQTEYDLARARTLIYGNNPPTPTLPPLAEPEMSPDERRAIAFGVHDLFVEAMEALPAETLKLIVFVPYHNFAQGRAGSRRSELRAECKSRLATIARGYENVVILDYMRASEITTDDTRYWDSLHYGVATAQLIVRQIGLYLRDGTRAPNSMSVVLDTRAGS